MDDQKLSSAIAEELGIVSIFFRRDWPNDIAAAMSLIDDGKGDCHSIDCATLEFEAGSWRVGMSAGMQVSGEHINESLPRAICEAWLAAKKDEWPLPKEAPDGS